MRTQVAAALALACGAALAGCSTESAQDEVELPGSPGRIASVTGEPGEPVVLTAELAEGDVVQASLSPLPMTQCGQEHLTLEGPDGEEEQLATLDPWTRVAADGTWTWTFEPCSDDEATYTIDATPGRVLPLETDGDPVTLAEHAHFVDVASFVVPRDERAILLGKPTHVLDPNGTRIGLLPDGERLRLDGRATPGTYTVIGTGDFSLSRPVKREARVDDTVHLTEPEDEPVAEYETTFTVTEKTWLTAPLHDWHAASFEELPPRSIAHEDASTDGTRLGGGMDGLWHLEPGTYIAHVTPTESAREGTLSLTSLTPTEITGPGTYTLSTSDEGDPAVAVFDLPGDNHTIEVLDHEGGTEVPWLLTWARDEAPTGPASTIPNDSWFPSTIGGSGYLALSTDESERHTIQIRIGTARD